MNITHLLNFLLSLWDVTRHSKLVQWIRIQGIIGTILWAVAGIFWGFDFVARVLADAAGWLLDTMTSALGMSESLSRTAGWFPSFAQDFYSFANYVVPLQEAVQLTGGLISLWIIVTTVKWILKLIPTMGN